MVFMPESEHPEALRSIKRLFEKAGDVVLVSHVHADGDAVGSTAALHDHLAGKGKRVQAYLFEPVAGRYAFLEADRFIRVFDPEDASMREKIRAADVVVALDLATWDRIPGWEELLQGFAGRIVCLDHHPPPEHPLGDPWVIDMEAAATGQLLQDLFLLDGRDPSRYASLCLFTALATDTGWFRYTNTRADTLIRAGRLLQSGIEPSWVFGQIYQENPFSHVRMTGKLASESRSELQGRLLWVSLPWETLRAEGLDRLDTEDLLDMLRSVKSSECVALFREEADGSVRVNLRSKGNVIVNELAARFGGGGHRKAAGITMRGVSLREAERQIVTAIKEHLRNGEGDGEKG